MCVVAGGCEELESGGSRELSRELQGRVGVRSEPTDVFAAEGQENEDECMDTESRTQVRRHRVRALDHSRKPGPRLPFKSRKMSAPLGFRIKAFSFLSLSSKKQGHVESGRHNRRAH